MTCAKKFNRFLKKLGTLSFAPFILCLAAAFLNPDAKAQLETLTIKVSSLQILSDKTADTGEQTEEASKQGGTIQRIGRSSKIRARFMIEGPLSAQVPKEDQRIGLFLKLDDNITASMARGKLESCVSSFCSAVFESNSKIEFHSDKLKNAKLWHVMIVPSPVLADRLVPGENQNNKTKTPKSISLGCGIQGISLSENSTTIFNEAKSSQKLSYGRICTGEYQHGRWIFNYSTYNVALSTQGFFTNSFSTSYKEQWFRVSYKLDLWGPWTVDVSPAFSLINFTTTNDDFAIISTNHKLASLGAQLNYQWNKRLFGRPGSWFQLLAGQTFATIDWALWGQSKDPGEFKRGESAAADQIKFNFGHQFLTGSKSIWVKDFVIGLGASLSLYESRFTGSAEGPSFGLDDGTVASGKRFFINFSLGRRVYF